MSPPSPSLTRGTSSPETPMATCSSGSEVGVCGRMLREGREGGSKEGKKRDSYHSEGGDDDSDDITTTVTTNKGHNNNGE